MSDDPGSLPATRAEVCVLAIAECFRGDGEILANPIGTIPMIGGRLARATFSPDLVMTDGEAAFVTNDEAFDFTAGKVIEAYNPYRAMFDMVWSGRRHVIMSGSQLDAHGNHNFAAIGDDWDAPKVSLLGFRGAPGNTIQNATSYWIPNHSRQVFVEKVDVVTGVGFDRAGSAPHFGLRRVVTNLCVMDFLGSGNPLRLLSVHPGVEVDEVVRATGVDLEMAAGPAGSVAESAVPDGEQLRLIREVIDPLGLREREVPNPV